jgi:hypothetical protein
MLQELRGKKDKFSDKMYRLPVGGGPVQVHVENAVSLCYKTTKPVVIVHTDVHTLIKIAWAIKLYNISGVQVNMTPVPGKLSELSDYMTTELKGKIQFNYDCVTVGSPRQEKTKSEADLFDEIYHAHYNYFNSLPVGMALVVKSFYFPRIEGIMYIKSSEPHNGSCVVYKSKALSHFEGTYEAKWKASHAMRKMNITFSYYKTMFTLSRELVMRKVHYRIPMRVEPPAPTLTPELIADDGEVPAEMGELEDEYPPENVPAPPQSVRSSNSSNTSPVAPQPVVPVGLVQGVKSPLVPAQGGGPPPNPPRNNQHPQRKKRQVKKEEEEEPLQHLNDD